MKEATFKIELEITIKYDENKFKTRHEAIQKFVENTDYNFPVFDHIKEVKTQIIDVTESVL